MGVVPKTVQQGGGQLLVAKNLYPLPEGEVRGDHRRADLVTLGEQVEEQLPSGSLEWDEPQLVEDQEIHPP